MGNSSQKCLTLMIHYRKLVLLILMVLMLSLQGAFAAITLSPDIAAIQKRGVLVAAFYQGQMPPFFMQDQNGVWSGIDVDFAEMIAKQLGVKLAIKTSSTYDGVIDLLATGKADMGLGLLTITPERALIVKFSDSYYNFHPHLLVNRLQLGQLDWTVWNMVDHMETTTKPLKFGALESSANIEILQQAFPAATVIAYPSMDAALQAVVDGQVFASVGNTPQQVHNWLEQHPQNILQVADIEMPDKLVSTAIAVPWQDEQLRQFLNVYIRYMKQNGLTSQLFQKYGEEANEQ